MRYIDKVIKKLFVFSINKLNDNLDSINDICNYYEINKNISFIYFKDINDQKFF